MNTGFHDSDHPLLRRSPLALLLALCLTACSAPALPPAPPPPEIQQTTLNAGAIDKLLASPDRSEADRRNDVRRKPAQLLAFLNLSPGMTALDLSAGGGYTTELLARAIGRSGRVYGQTQPRNPGQKPPATPEGGASPAAATSPPTVNATADGRTPSERALLARQKALLAAGVDAARIVPVVQRFETPVPGNIGPASLDIVTLMFNYHDLGHLGTDRQQMNRAIFAALKPGGIYVVADHAGRPGTGISESGTLHRIEEAFLRREIEAAGFRFLAEAGFLRNPADPRDQNTPVPAQPKDDFVMKFFKP